MRASQIDITCNIIMKSKNALLVHIKVVRSAYTTKLDSTHILNILVSPLLTSLTIVSQGQPFIVSDQHNLEAGWSKMKAAMLCSQCFEIFQHLSSPTLNGSFCRIPVQSYALQNKCSNTMLTSRQLVLGKELWYVKEFTRPDSHFIQNIMTLNEEKWWSLHFATIKQARVGFRHKIRSKSSKRRLVNNCLQCSTQHTLSL